jgi:hypothetical protein
MLNIKLQNMRLILSVTVLYRYLCIDLAAMQAHCAEATARSRATASNASASACTSGGDAYEPASRPRISARSEPTRRVHAALRRSSSNGLLLPVLVLAAASGVSTGVACSNYKTGGRETGVLCAFAYGSTAFMHSHCPRVPWFTRRTAGEGVSSILPSVCAQRVVDKTACWKGAGAWKWYSIYLLYSYKITSTDTEAGGAGVAWA